MYAYVWYKGKIDRNKSMEILNQRRGNNRGIFIVRDSTRDKTKPYTLDVMYDDHDFHIPLRLRHDNHFAMGTSQQDEDVSVIPCQVLGTHTYGQTFTA